MRTLLSLLITIGFGWCTAQEMSYAEYQKEAKINKRLLPKHGNFPKSDDEKTADLAFIERSIEEYQSREKASEAKVMEGYQALNSNPKEAMICFNQAFLLDSTNANIYWGYGQLFHHFDQYQEADGYFEEGLTHNPKSTMLLNAMGKNCLEMYHQDGNEEHLQRGIKKLQSSFMIEPSKAETSKTLTGIFLELKNCEKAKKYYQVYKATEKGEHDTELAKLLSNQCKLSQ